MMDGSMKHNVEAAAICAGREAADASAATAAAAGYNFCSAASDRCRTASRRAAMMYRQGATTGVGEAFHSP
jgi:hypothetical protein